MRILLHMGDPYVIDNPCTKRMRAFREQFESHGHEVVILAPDTGSSEKAPGVVYCKTLPLKKKTSFYRLLNAGSFALQSIKEAKKTGSIDVVLTTCPPPLINLSGWVIARSKHAKLIYDVRDIWPDVALEMKSFSEKSIYCRVFAWIKKFMLKHADLVTAVSQGKVSKLSSEAGNKPVVYISNGFDRHFLDNQMNEELYGRLSLFPGFKCIYVGNLGLAQGLMQLLQIAERAQENNLNASFILYGSGAEEKQLKEYVIKQKIKNVHFEGRLPNKDMYTVLKAGDMSFVPLVNGNLKDSIPTKMYESLGSGCPVLLVAEGDSVKILRDTGYGIAVSPYREAELWEAFLKLYHRDEAVTEKKEYAVNLMKNKYSLDIWAKKLVEEAVQLCSE